MQEAGFVFRLKRNMYSKRGNTPQAACGLLSEAEGEREWEGGEQGWRF